VEVQDGQVVDYLQEVLHTQAVVVAGKVMGREWGRLAWAQPHNQHLLRVGTDTAEVVHQQEELVAAVVRVALAGTPLVLNQAMAGTGIC